MTDLGSAGPLLARSEDADIFAIAFRRADGNVSDKEKDRLTN
jgi:hypothetical protein